MDLTTILIMFGIFVVLTIPGVILSKRCAGCRKFSTFRETGNSKPEVSFFEPAQAEWECPDCGHLTWRNK